MKNYNWKDIKKIIEGYPSDDERVKPIIVYGSEFPVKLKSKFYEYLGFKSMDHYSSGNKIKDEKYTFYSALSESSNRYKITVQAFNSTKYGEGPVLLESESFHQNRRKDVNEFFKMPLSYFEMNGHIRLMTFKDTTMKEQEFKEIIELWRTQPSQTKS